MSRYVVRHMRERGRGSYLTRWANTRMGEVLLGGGCTYGWGSRARALIFDSRAAAEDAAWRCTVNAYWRVVKLVPKSTPEPSKAEDHA